MEPAEATGRTTAAPSPPPQPQTRQRMVTARAVLLALLLMPVNALWVVKMEVTRYAGHPTTISLFFNVVFWLLLLLGANAGLRRLRPAWAFAPGELLTVYVMLALGSAMAGHDMVEVLTPILSHANRYATPANGWADRILPHLPAWLTVADKQALEEFYTGTGRLYDPPNLRAWATPVLAWTGFFTLLGFLMLCINTLLRRQWTENEKLAYPLVTLPLEMVRPGAPLFKTPLFWLGCGTAASLELWNGLAFLYPSIPALPLKSAPGAQDLSAHLPHPWRAMGWTPAALYPFGIALGMLLPTDLLFSSWFFAWVWRMERVAGAHLGLTALPEFPYVEAQSFGAYAGVAAFALWGSRAHLKRIFWDGLFDRRVDLGDGSEPLPYRWAAVGLLAGGGLLFLFCRACGMSPWVVVAFFGIYLLISVAVTRMRAELGPPAHDLHRAGPDSLLPMLVPQSQFARTDLAMFSLFYGFNRAYRAHPMPIQLEGFKMAEQAGGPGAFRPLFWAMLLAVAFGTLCGFWANLDQGYRYGAAARIGPPNVMTIFGGEPWTRMNSWVVAPPQAHQQGAQQAAVGVGFGFTMLLNLLRLRVVGFPLHPVGYAISSSWSLSLLWLPLLIAWVLKVSLLRYGGLAGYRRALPLFLGVIVGECAVGSLWTLVGIWLDVPTYAFWP